jgi:DNA mismatch repair protein MutS
MAEQLTPMMQQYQSIRRSLPADTLLLFRLGDFYEMFFDDAKEASAILNVALTKRNSVPMCGVPYHAADNYVRRLIAAGRRVAICDQTSQPQPGKIVEREITHIVSPGTVADLHMLDARRNNFLAALWADPKTGRIGFAYIDTTIGDFRLTELAEERELTDELARVQPVEVLVSDDQAPMFRDVRGVVARETYIFLADQAVYTLREQFKVQSLDGFGCGDVPLAVSAAGAVVHYLRNELRRSLDHVTRLQVYRNSQFMVLDAATQVNLELVQSRHTPGASNAGIRDTSLLAALDRTVTPMGARKLRDWILHPLCDARQLSPRQQMIGDLIAEPYLLGQIRETLKAIRDIERTVGRLTQTGGNARDLMVLRTALEQIPALRADLEALRVRDGGFGVASMSGAQSASLQSTLLGELHPLPHVVELLAKAIVDEPPGDPKDGGIFRDGYSAQLDELRSASREGKTWIAELQERLIEETGIKSLKVRFTSVFGYFIEITKSNLASVPPTWHRKQTVANGERYITPELKEVESRILGADERARALEFDLFVHLRNEVMTELLALQATARAVAEIDVIGSLAETARLYGYCRPALLEAPECRSGGEADSDGGEGSPQSRAALRISIVDGRHPVLDQSLVEEKFVPNDVQLDGEKNRLLILTGPNMAGKSTYIRQVALLVLMAQIGSWVPAKSAEIGLADRIFTRVGASDDLARGQSTFMVEMNETANICHNATERSLVILDEIGRGTSTFDGLSIAWSVAEYLHDEVRARTLFATHYHELTELELTRSGVKNYNVAVREWNEQVIFLRKIIRGGADKSYGIQVARLAGLPVSVIARAKEILSNLEQHELNADGQPTLAEPPPPPKFGKPRGKRKAAQALAEMKPQMRLF